MAEKLNDDIAFYNLLEKLEGHQKAIDAKIAYLSRIHRQGLARCLWKPPKGASSVPSLNPDWEKLIDELGKFYKTDEIRKTVMEAVINLYAQIAENEEQARPNPNTVINLDEVKKKRKEETFPMVMLIDPFLKDRCTFYELKRAGIQIKKKEHRETQKFFGQIGNFKFHRFGFNYKLQGESPLPLKILTELYGHQKNLDLPEVCTLKNPSHGSSGILEESELVYLNDDINIFTESALKLAADRIKNYLKKLKKEKKPHLKLVKTSNSDFSK